MRARGLAVIAALAVIASSGTALAAPGEFFGVVTIHPPDGLTLARMEQARVGVLRQPFGWAGLEPSEGTYNFADYDRVVAGAATRGITVLPFVFGTPPWARNCSGIPDFYCDRVTPLRSIQGRQRWPALLRALVDRYGPNGTLWTDPNDAYSPPYRPIRTWQIWNEPNSATYFRPRPRPKAYYQLLKSASNAIHSRDAGARIMLGGLFGTPPKPGIPLWTFLDRLYRFKNAKKLFSAIAVHPYSPNIKGIAYQLRRARQVMGDHGDKKTPLFITEIGWGSDPPGTGGSPLFKGISGQAQMLTKSFKFALKNRKRYRLRGVSWFTWRDEPVGTAGNCLLCESFGLFGADASPKPALDAFLSFTGGS